MVAAAAVYLASVLSPHSASMAPAAQFRCHRRDRVPTVVGHLGSQRNVAAFRAAMEAVQVARALLAIHATMKDVARVKRNHNQEDFVMMVNQRLALAQQFLSAQQDTNAPVDYAAFRPCHSRLHNQCRSRCHSQYYNRCHSRAVRAAHIPSARVVFRHKPGTMHPQAAHAQLAVNATAHNVVSNKPLLRRDNTSRHPQRFLTLLHQRLSRQYRQHMRPACAATAHSRLPLRIRAHSPSHRHHCRPTQLAIMSKRCGMRKSRAATATLAIRKAAARKDMLVRTIDAVRRR